VEARLGTLWTVLTGYVVKKLRFTLFFFVVAITMTLASLPAFLLGQYLAPKIGEDAAMYVTLGCFFLVLIIAAAAYGWFQRRWFLRTGRLPTSFDPL
jgi:hypothetical protein